MSKKPSNFITKTILRVLPELTMAWTAVEQFHPDSYALDVLANYLGAGQKSTVLSGFG